MIQSMAWILNLEKKYYHKLFLCKRINVCFSPNQFYSRVFSFRVRIIVTICKNRSSRRKQLCTILDLSFFCQAACFTDKLCRDCGHCEAPCHYCHQHFLLQMSGLCPQGFCRREVRERGGRECGLESGRRACPTTKIGKCKIRSSIYHQGKRKSPVNLVGTGLG